jgi:hypothetical protein
VTIAEDAIKRIKKGASSTVKAGNKLNKGWTPLNTFYTQRSGIFGWMEGMGGVVG